MVVVPGLYAVFGSLGRRLYKAGLERRLDISLKHLDTSPRGQPGRVSTAAIIMSKLLCLVLLLVFMDFVLLDNPGRDRINHLKEPAAFDEQHRRRGEYSWLRDWGFDSLSSDDSGAEYEDWDLPDDDPGWGVNRRWRNPPFTRAPWVTSAPSPASLQGPPQTMGSPGVPWLVPEGRSGTSPYLSLSTPDTGSRLSPGRGSRLARHPGRGPGTRDASAKASARRPAGAPGPVAACKWPPGIMCRCRVPSYGKEISCKSRIKRISAEKQRFQKCLCRHYQLCKLKEKSFLDIHKICSHMPKYPMQTSPFSYI